jgi:hypothetical protein
MFSLDCLVNVQPLMPALEELQFHYCRQLKSLNGVSAEAPNLKKLLVTRCANLDTSDEALNLSIESVYINVRGKALVKRPDQRLR